MTASASCFKELEEKSSEAENQLKENTTIWNNSESSTERKETFEEFCSAPFFFISITAISILRLKFLKNLSIL